MPAKPNQPQRGDHGQNRGEPGRRQRPIDEVRDDDELQTQADEDELDDEDDGDEDEEDEDDDDAEE